MQRYIYKSNGKSYCDTIYREKIKKLVDNKGYFKVLLNQNGKSRSFLVHRLVAQAFISNTENKKEVNHIDGNKHNNNVTNLEWVSPKENVRHGFDTGLITRAKSKEHYKARRVHQFDLQGNFVKEWDCMMDIQRELNIPQPNIYKVCSNQRKTAGGYVWRYV